jgi:hypothetical protein
LNLVYVINKHGKPLMPCCPRKARLLLKESKAEVINRTPLTIQLVHGSSGYKQPVTLGVDSGFLNIGLSAVSEKQELYAGEVQLRTDMVELNSERRRKRSLRRNRNTWYRQPRFLNRGNKKDGWLAPSIQHKLDSHHKVIKQVKSLIPISKTIVEVAAFDIQKIKNPEIKAEGYQQGEQLGFWNVREYVLHRDDHICQSCKGKSKDKALNVHHLKSRKTGGDRPDNLITLCKTCHTKHHDGKKINLKVKLSNGFKAETFMSMVRWKLINQLKESTKAVFHTYGYLTKTKRIDQKLTKSHINDAFVIANGNKQKRAEAQYIQEQVRKSNRKLFKGIRSHIKNTASRFVKGFQRFDKVLWKGIECFIFGRRKTGYFDLRKLEGVKVHASAKAKDCILLESAKTLLTERRTAIPLGFEKPSLLAEKP